MKWDVYKLERKKMKIGVLLIATLIVASAIFAIWVNIGPRNTGVVEAKQELTLVSPAFLSSESVVSTTLSQEAGMSIWLNATNVAPLSLTAAQNAMVNIENVTSTYVIGSVSLQTLGFASDDWPHCVVFQSGWVVVYYLKVNANPSTTASYVGKIFPMYTDSHWHWYDKGTLTLNDNLLHKALALVCSQIPQISDISSAQYYHFQYPNAKTLEIMIKTESNPGLFTQTSTFDINIPDSVAIDEGSYSFYSYYGGGLSIGTSTTTTQLVAFGSVYRQYGQIPASVLASRGIWLTVTVATAGSTGGNYYTTAAIVILYH